MRHVGEDGEGRGTPEWARRRLALAGGLAGLAVGAAIASGGIAAADHTSQVLPVAPAIEGGGPPSPAPPPPSAEPNDPAAPPAAAPGDGIPGQPGAPAPPQP